MKKNTDHNANRIRRSTGIFACALLTAGLAPVTVSAQMQGNGGGQQQPQQQQPPQQNQQSGEVQQKLAEIQRELQQVNAEVNAVRTEAASKSEVQEAMFSYQETLTAAMSDAAPDQSDEIDRRFDLLQKIISAPDYEEMDNEQIQEFRKWNEEFAELRGELQPVEQEASQEEAVAEARQEYADTLSDTMMEMDPDLDEKISERDELMKEFRELQQSVSN